MSGWIQAAMQQNTIVILRSLNICYDFFNGQQDKQFQQRLPQKDEQNQNKRAQHALILT